MPKKATARKRGGKRAGAGRPRTQPRDLPWAQIRKYAEAGAEEPEIIKGLGIPDDLLELPANLTRFRDEIARCHAWHKLELRTAILNRGKKTSKTAGSVNALALQARNILDWDKSLPAQETEPDLGTARDRLRALFVKLAVSRSEVEGRTVTPLELLHMEAEIGREAPPVEPGS